MIRAAAVVLALLVVIPAAAQPRFELLQTTSSPLLVMPAPNNVTTNWQNAGLSVIGGIPTRNTICSTVNPTGVTTAGPTDDYNTLATAYAACPANEVVQLGSGTFNFFTSELPFHVNKSNVTIRGTGSTTGTCNFTTGTACWPTVVQVYDGPLPTYNSAPQCGINLTVSSYTYNSGTGAVVATMSASVGFGSGASIFVSGLNISGVNGSFTTTSGTTGTSVHYTAATGLSGAASGGGLLANISACANGLGVFAVDPQGNFNTGLAGCAWPAGTINPTTNNCGTTLASDAAQGATVVSVNSTTNLSVGAWVVIDENPGFTTTTNPIPGQASIQATPEFLSTSPSPAINRIANPDGSNCTYSFCVNRVTEEMHLITAIAGGGCPCNVTFDSPLTVAFRQSSSHDARVYWLTAQTTTTPITPVSGAAIENMTIARCPGGCIDFLFAVNSWATNVETVYWIGGGVNTTGSARIYVGHVYDHDCIDCQNNGEEYPLGISSASTEVLVEDSIFTFGGKGMVVRAAGGNVVAYNYVDKTFYEQNGGIGNYWNDMGANASHYAGSHHNLLEGNYATNCDGDETHGSGSYQTFSFNYCFGYRTPFTDPSNGLAVNDCAGTGYGTGGISTPIAPAPLRAAGPMALSYWFAYVGNVLGNSAMQSCATTYAPFVYGATSTFTKGVIWRSGWTGSEWSDVTDANLDGVNGSPFIFKNCNYDYVNTSQADCATGYSHSLPNSFYLPSSGASPPSWWPNGSTTYPFPWVVASSGTPVKTNSLSGSGLPAKARYDAGTPFVQP